MGRRRLQGLDMRRMIATATRCLEKHRAEVDQLNVYPVPDGDTGTNLLLTLRSAQAEVDKVASTSLSEVSGAIATGSLLGARGNSGVIVSQIFRGLARVFEGKAEADGRDVSLALQEGVQAAYRAVVKPVEGTILTVAKEAARCATEVSRRTRDVVAVLRAAWNGARESLPRTPELLPVLKRAGVVDAGGQGFVYILEGLVAALVGEEGSAVMTDYPSGRATENPPLANGGWPGEAAAVAKARSAGVPVVGANAYDLVALVAEGGSPGWEQVLEEMGDSLLVVHQGELAKVHIHTARPDQVLAVLMAAGPVLEARVEDMRQGEGRWRESGPLTGSAVAASVTTGAMTETAEVALAVVSVSPGPGWSRLMLNLGAASVVDGGATMNPSARELLQAVRGAGAATVVLLPNHANALAAARQAAALAAPLRVEVLPSDSPARGLAALVAFNPQLPWKENEEPMRQAMQAVTEGQVTRAARGCRLGERHIPKGSYMAMVGEELVAVESDRMEALLVLVGHLLTPASEVVSVFYGGTVSPGEAGLLEPGISARFPGVSVEVHLGGQLCQEFVVSVE